MCYFFEDYAHYDFYIKSRTLAHLEPDSISAVEVTLSNIYGLLYNCNSLYLQYNSFPGPVLQSHGVCPNQAISVFPFIQDLFLK